MADIVENCVLSPCLFAGEYFVFENIRNRTIFSKLWICWEKVLWVGNS